MNKYKIKIPRDHLLVRMIPYKKGSYLLIFEKLPPIIGYPAELTLIKANHKRRKPNVKKK